MKVFMDGKRLKDIYPHATRWQVFKYKCARFIRKVLIVGIIGTVFAVMTLILFPRYKVMDKIVKVDNLAVKVVELKSEVMNDLRECESQGAVEDDGLIIFDSNKKASIGLYQFQKSTIIYYYKALYGKDITGKEAVLIALDSKLARSLAEDIIFTDEKGIDNWYNCKNKKGLADNVSWIKKISK